MLQTLQLIDNKAAIAKPEFYTCIDIDIKSVLESWKTSVFSYEWLNQDGSIKEISELKDTEAERRKLAENAFSKGESLEKPILGIGINDNIEIGSGRAVLLTLATKSITHLQVHIPKSNESDFKPFLADVS